VGTPTDSSWDGASRGADVGGDLRSSDAEREAAVKALGDHLAAGRLAPAEFDERAGLAFAARTRGDLARLFADLPGDARAAGQAARRSGPGVAVPIRFLIPVAVALAAVAAFALAGPEGRPGFPWPLIPIFFVLSRRPWRWNRGVRPWKQ
jgi:hypothetical protein